MLAELGSGGMGVVYAVYDRQRGEKLALKTLQREDPAALLRLKNEFRALQDLQHPNLVTLGELFHEHEQWYFTMELVQGVDFITYVRGSGTPAWKATAPVNGGDSSSDAGLSSEDGTTPDSSAGADGSDSVGGHPIVPEEARFDEVRLRACLAQLAEGLAVLHAAGRVHRDIKPGNILVEPRGRLVLLDFGLVTQVEPSQKSVEEHLFPLGTVGYMAPEQAAQHDVSPATDWYAVGVVLFEALTGRLPFSGSVFKVLVDKQLSTPRRPREHVPAVPQDLDDLCKALLERDPAARPTGTQVLRVARGGRPECAPVRSSGSTGSCAPVFVGRRSELASMFAAYDTVASGEAVSLLVHGQSGVGKSELLRSFSRQLAARDEQALVLSGRCYERESLPYKAFDGVVDSLSEHLACRPAASLAGLVPSHVSLLLRLFPVLGRIGVFRDAPPVRFGVEDLQEVRSLAFQALRELFVRLADRQIVVVAIDDYQWADEDSKKLLRALVQPPGPPKMLLLVAMRTAGAEQEAAQEVGEVLGAFPQRPRLLALGSLSEQESRELARALSTPDESEGPGAARRLDQIAQESGGHPLFIRELVHHASDRRADAGPADTYVRLDDALWARVEQLDRTARDLVEALSVATGPLEQSVVADAIGVGVAEMFRLSGRLRKDRLVGISGPSHHDTIEVYHDRLRQAVMAKSSNAVLRGWHDKLAKVMLASPRPEPERLAFHLENAGYVQEAAKYAAQAGDRAAESLAFKRAADLYRRALASWPEPTSPEQVQATRQLQIKLGEALANAGRGPESAQAYQLAVPGASAEEALVLERRAAEQLLRSGHVEHGLRVVHEVLASLGMRLPRSTAGTFIALLWQRLRLRCRGLGFPVRKLDDVPVEAIIQADVCNAISQGLAMIDTVRGAYFSTRFVRMALDMGERARVMRALWMEANYAANTGLPARYVSRLHQSMRLLIDETEPLTAAYLRSAYGFDAFMKGKWADALECFESTERVFSSRGGSVWERTTFRLFIGWSLYYLGELAELTRRVTPLYADAVDRGDRYAAWGFLLGLAHVAHLNALGAPETRRLIDETTRSWSKERYYLRDYYALLALTQVDLFEGEGVSAHRRMVDNWRGLSRSLLLMIPSVRVEADHLRARSALAAASRLPSARRASLLAEAARHTRRLARQRAPWARALALPLAAASAWQDHDTARAVKLLRDSVDALDRAQMKLFAAAARRRLGELVGGDEGSEQRAMADRFFAEQQVRDPERMVEMLAPGFSTPT